MDMFLPNKKNPSVLNPMSVSLFLLMQCMVVSIACAAVMESTSYKMSADSVNVGGMYGESASYHMEDTLGEVATGDGESTSYRLRAGYQQMHASTISVTLGTDITLDPLTMTQNTAVASTAWTVTTDNTAGYTLSVDTASVPALVDGGTGESFIDYTEGTPGTPETWTVTSACEFGFSARGTHVPSGTWGTDADCVASANIPSSALKWRGFDGGTDIDIASSNARTDITGVSTTMCVATEQEGVFAPSGTYTATVTATAIAR